VKKTNMIVATINSFMLFFFFFPLTSSTSHHLPPPFFLFFLSSLPSPNLYHNISHKKEVLTKRGSLSGEKNQMRQLDMSNRRLIEEKTLQHILVFAAATTFMITSLI